MSDIVVRWSIPGYHGHMTHTPSEDAIMYIEGNAIPVPGSGDWGDNTLEFDLGEVQFVPIDLVSLRIRINVYRDHFEVVELPKRYQEPLKLGG